MLEIRKYQVGDEAGFQRLDNLVEEHPWNRRDLANWKWKFRGKNPAGEPLMIYAANDSEIVGHFAAIPMKYWIDGESVIGSHSAAMMVDPKWQNRGLIKFVADKLIQELEIQGIPFTYGYPNENAYELHIKLLGYEEIAKQQFYIKKINFNDDEKNSSTGTLTWTKITKFGDETNYLWENSKNEYNVIVERKSDFLNWRYLNRPDVLYHAYGVFTGNMLEGYCVLKLYQEEQTLRGHFIDLFTSHNNNVCASVLIRQGLQFFKEKRVSEVTLWMQGCSFIKKLLLENGFREGGIAGAGWQGSTRPMVCRFNSEKEKYKPLLNERDCYFTMGDTLEIF
jgi:predicted N-acetyltransferase YhbS